jgi:hypothetical protein
LTEAFNVIGLSTRTFNENGWLVLGAGQSVQGMAYFWNGSTWTVTSTSWTVEELLDISYQEGRTDAINDVADRLVEQFMVWPGTSAPAGWTGWCSTIIGTATVPIVCP